MLKKRVRVRWQVNTTMPSLTQITLEPIFMEAAIVGVEAAAMEVEAAVTVVGMQI